MKQISLILSIIFVAFISALLFSFTTLQEKPWNVPEAAQKVKNPTKSSAENVKIGRMLYDKHCKSCHGKSGEGDGPKAAELDTPAGDFTTAEFHTQSDGALYYKTTEGRDDMPTFKKKVSSDEDRWLIVHYLRTLKQ